MHGYLFKIPQRLNQFYTILKQNKTILKQNETCKYNLNKTLPEHCPEVLLSNDGE